MATLPSDVQESLAEWEDARNAELAKAQEAAEERRQAKWLLQHPQPEPVEEDEESEDDENTEPPAELSYDELKAKATELGLDFPGNISKVDLKAMIESAEAEAAEGTEGTTTDEE